MPGANNSIFYTLQSSFVCQGQSWEAQGGSESQHFIHTELPLVMFSIRPGPASTHHVHSSPVVRQLWYCYKPPAG